MRSDSSLTAFCWLIVEMRGVEPLSKSSPTFRRLQFISLSDKTADTTMSEQSAEFSCILFGFRLQESGSPYPFTYAACIKRRIYRPGSLQDLESLRQRMRSLRFCWYLLRLNLSVIWSQLHCSLNQTETCRNLYIPRIMRLINA